MRPFFFMLMTVCCFVCQLAQGQNLYDYQHTKKFAEHLYSTQRYLLAADEFERVVFMDSATIDDRFKLIQSYRLSGGHDIAFDRLKEFYPTPCQMPQSVASEYLKLCLLTSDFVLIDSFFVNCSVKSKASDYYRTCSLLLQSDWPGARKLATESVVLQNDFKDLYTLSQETATIRYKRPFVAAGMSALIPGTGKIYSGDYANGLISMLLVAANAWQSYRGFHRKGPNSIYGWVFAGFTGGFYLGNVYGSAKSAKLYNKRLDEKYHKKVVDMVFGGL